LPESHQQCEGVIGACDKPQIVIRFVVAADTYSALRSMAKLAVPGSKPRWIISSSNSLSISLKQAASPSSSG
jgi:hypothetical protein